MLKKILVALLVVALMPAQAAWGEQFVPKGVDESQGDVAVLVKDIFTTGASFVMNRGQQDKQGNTPFCKSLSSESCNTGGNADLVIYQMLPLCQIDSTSSCIEGLSIYTGESNSQPATYVRNVAGIQFPGLPKVGLPASYTPSIWDASNAPNASGSTKYVVGAQIRWSYYKGRLTLQSFSSAVHPVEELSGSSWVPSHVGVFTRNGKQNTYLDAGRGNSDIECAATDTGYCARIVNFAEGTRVSLNLRLSKSVTGWLQGRISKPTISVTSFSSELNSVKVDASPVAVPQFYTELKMNDQPKWLQDALYWWHTTDGNNNTGGRKWRIYSAEGENVVRITKALAQKSGDTAANVATKWNISSLGIVNTGNRCLDNASRLVGLVTTNALAYSGGVPRFRNGFLSYQVAGTHYLPDGVTKAEGTYDLALRSETARCLYGFSQAPISGTISVIGDKGEKRIATTVVREKAGWVTLAAYGFTFSSPTIKVKLTQKR
ncbi:MAG: hypothetical protein F2614_03425 [Actinobacteria bacterium]|uniref:Unannotated protein n=1 Tax=freshwater metagenome TaxID=449393 RepID=A0A6J6JI55_9ZZZZ|nr:hypothetical protein [Actinomycetota bacterium]